MFGFESLGWITIGFVVQDKKQNSSKVQGLKMENEWWSMPEGIVQQYIECRNFMLHKEQGSAK